MSIIQADMIIGRYDNIKEAKYCPIYPSYWFISSYYWNILVDILLNMVIY